MAASRERAAPVFIGLPFGSAAVFVAAVACGRSHPAVALLLLAGVVVLTAWASERWVAFSVAAVGWFSFVGLDLVGDGDLRLDHGRNLTYLVVLGLAAAAGRLVADIGVGWRRRRGRVAGRHRDRPVLHLVRGRVPPFLDRPLAASPHLTSVQESRHV
jgi:hypothetical protein